MVLVCIPIVFLSTGFTFAAIDPHTKTNVEKVSMPSTVDISYYNTARYDKSTNSALYIEDYNSTTNYSDIRIYGSEIEASTSGVDCTYGTPKSLSKGKSTYLSSTVFSKGYSKAGLRLKLSNTRGAYVYFGWKADTK